MIDILILPLAGHTVALWLGLAMFPGIVAGLIITDWLLTSQSEPHHDDDHEGWT